MFVQFVFFFVFALQQLPVKIYESVIDIVQGEATMLFVNLLYTLATEEAERIGVDHVVRTSTHENGGKSAGKFVHPLEHIHSNFPNEKSIFERQLQLPSI